MAEEQAQPEGQAPEVSDLARTAALSILASEGDVGAQAELQKNKPRDPDTGKFVPKEQPQAEAPAAAEAQEPTAEAPPVQKYKFTVKGDDGADLEVEEDVEGLKKGYMLERSYRQKTAQIAREKESVQAKIKEAVEQRQKEYEEKLALAEQVIWHTLAPEIKNTDWNKLAAENPAEWAQRYQRVQAINSTLAAVQAERRKFDDARADEQKKALEKHIQESRDTLSREVTGWSDELYKKILKTGVEYGFTAEEMKAMTDHRAVKVLNDARQFRELKAKPIVEKKVVEVPKVAKPGAGDKPDPNAEKVSKAREQLRKTGKTRDAEALMLELIKSQAIG